MMAAGRRFSVEFTLQEFRAMSTPLPTYLNCSQEVVGGLIETVTAALLNSFPVIDADPEDIEMTLDALKVLRPKVVELETFAALLQMQRGHWDEAIHIFSRLVANVPQFAYAKALLAFCLSFKGDPNWRQSAAEAIRENPDRETRQLVRALAARDDLQDALRAHKNGAPFEVPPSIATLADDIDADSTLSAPASREAADPAPVPAGHAQGEAVPQPGYLRI
jgi:type III secretion protein HrpB1